MSMYMYMFLCNYGDDFLVSPFTLCFCFLQNTSRLARRLLNGELEPSKILNMSPSELKVYDIFIPFFLQGFESCLLSVDDFFRDFVLIISFLFFLKK